MKRAVILLALVLPGCQVAYADPPPDGGPRYDRSSDAGEPEALPETPDGGKPWAPTFDVPFPEGTSPAPTAAEWLAAPEAKEVRVTQPGCKVVRVREWYRVHCSFTPWIELVTGAREGVSFGCQRREKGAATCDESWVTFPARRGDQRALELFTWSKWGPSPDALLTEQFLDGDPCPQVTLLGMRWEF
jgi:hypothetical protein